MILNFFRRKAKTNETITLRLYDAIVAAARQKRFYAEFLVPDIPLGRYEMLSLHIFLTMHRLKPDVPVLAALSQELADEFFKDVDHSLRELGIGDQAVPKRIKKLARMFYGRVGSYALAVDGNDPVELAAALTRNIRPELEFWPQAHHLGQYVFAARDFLANIDDDKLADGQIRFPDVETMVFVDKAELE